MNATDDFNRANESPLASPWAAHTGGGINLVSNSCTSGSAADKTSYYTGTWSNDQEAQVTVGSLLFNTNFAGVGVRLSTTGGGAGYIVFVDSGSGAGHTELGYYSGGTYNTLASAAVAFTDGDVLKISAVGTTIKAFQNSTEIISVTDSNVSSGNPGINAYGNATVDSFSATDVGGGGGGGTNMFVVLMGM